MTINIRSQSFSGSVSEGVNAIAMGQGSTSHVYYGSKSAVADSIREEATEPQSDKPNNETSKGKSSYLKRGYRGFFRDIWNIIQGTIGSIIASFVYSGTK